MRSFKIFIKRLLMKLKMKVFNLMLFLSHLKEKRRAK